MNLLRRFILIAFDRLPEERINLFEVFPRVREFFRERRLHRIVRTVGDIVFFMIIVLGLFGPQEADSNIAIFLAWGLWWPSVVLSWFLFSRMWCGFCPFPGLGRLFKHFKLSLELVPHKFLSKYGIHASVILFILIIFFEESLGIKESPRLTAILMLFILFGATITAIIYEKQAWCRYLCPMGRIIGTGATMSFLEFRPDHEKCRGCPTFACKRGIDGDGGCPVYLGAYNVRNNLDCLVCGHCIKLCDRDSPQINFRSPFEELIRNKGRFITCSYIIPFLIGSQIARLLHDKFLSGYHFCNELILCKLLYYGILFLVGFLFMVMFIQVGGDIFGIREDELFGRFSPFVPILVPVSFGGELLIRVKYFFDELPNFLPSFSKQFGINVPNIVESIPDYFVNSVLIFIILSSFLASFYVLYRFVHDEFSDMIPKLAEYSCYLMLIILLLIYVYLIPLE